MLQFFRRSRARLMGPGLILAWAFIAAPVELWHPDSGSAAVWQSAFVTHDAAAHHLDAGPARSPGRHDLCYTCHWLRSLQTVLLTRLRLEAVPLRGAALHRNTTNLPHQFEFVTLSGRSPPA